MSVRRFVSMSVVFMVFAPTSAVAAQGGRGPASAEFLRPTRELKDTYAYVSGVREVSGGRLLVVDASENRVWLVNATTGARSEAVTVGSGPLEALSPWALAHAGAETMIHDWKQHRLLVFDAAGKPTRTIMVPKLPAEQGIPDRSITGDDRGNIYLNASPFVRTANGLQPADGRAVLRISADGQHIDTMVVIPAIKNDVLVQTFPDGGVSTQTGAANPFVARDLWTATGDGRVALIHGAPFRVEWIDRRGARVVGPVIPYIPIPLTTADKEDFAARHGRGGSATATQPLSGGAASLIGGRDDWPAFKPPFLYDAVQSDQEGSIWIQRTAPFGDARIHYDVIDSRGEVARRVDLPGGYRIIGFGRRAIYAVHEADKVKRLAVFVLAE